MRAARGYGGPRVRTAALGEAARGPATRRREIGDRECQTYTRGFHICIPCERYVAAKQPSGVPYSCSTALIKQALVLGRSWAIREG